MFVENLSCFVSGSLNSCRKCIWKLNSQRVDCIVFNLLSSQLQTHNSLSCFVIPHLYSQNMSYSSIRGMLDLVSRGHWCDPSGNSSRKTLLFQIPVIGCYYSEQEISRWTPAMALRPWSHYQKPNLTGSGLPTPSCNGVPLLKTSSSPLTASSYGGPLLLTITNLYSGKLLQPPTGCVLLFEEVRLSASGEEGEKGSLLLVFSFFMFLFSQPTYR